MKCIPLILAACGLLSACAAASGRDSDFVSNMGAPDAPATMDQAKNYRINPNDQLKISIYQNKDLSQEKIEVDASGRILLPLIGTVVAGKKTTDELAEEISGRLKDCCLQSPQVLVSVVESPNSQITVTGAVIENGVFPVHGRTTLMQAIALAKGPDATTADMRHVAVFRNVGGRRVGAIYDLEAIRARHSQDPEVFGGDTVVVNTSSAKSAWKDLIGVAPVVGMVRLFVP